MTTTQENIERVRPEHADAAMIYRNGILDYDAHDAFLTSQGYSYLNLPCQCNGGEDDGHLPTCGWGRTLKEYEVRYRVLTAGNQFHHVQGYTEDDARDAVRKKHPEAFDIYIQHVPVTLPIREEK